MQKRNDNYLNFLKSKIDIAVDTGFDISPDEINPVLLPHQKDGVRWAIRGGRRALFESWGLGKTCQELETCRIITEHEGGQGLIVLPLGVKQEFVHDALHLLGWDWAPPYVRTMEEVKATKEPIMLTNYERVRDGDINPKYFKVTCLDEAAVLRSFGSKTYQTFLDKFKGVPYKFVATATPSPNKYKELIHYAGYLEIMDTGQSLTRFFQRDSTKANNLTLYPHKENEFWLWVSSWALFITKPSDLGYPDTGYEMPPLDIRYHEVPVNHKTAGTERDGQGKLFRDAAAGLTQAAREKRESIKARISEMAMIISENPDDHFILWHDLEAERHAIEEALPSTQYHHWQEYKDGHPKGLELYERHYSAYQYADGRDRKLFVGPGEKTILMTRNHDALFVWRKFIDASGQKGVNCAVFRNEGEMLSSELIKEAMAIAWLRWPGQRLYTYVNAEKIASTNPGYCFLKAGWQKCGFTQGGLIILEALPGCEVPDVKLGRAMEAIYGNQDYDVREQRVIDFSEGRIKYFATKKELSGQGCNFQRHCHRAIFIGIDYQFNDFIQAIHRIYRFLQTQQVRIDIIYTESERAVLDVLLKKWEQHDYMVAKMIEIVKKYGLSNTSMIDKLARSIGVDRVKIESKHFTAVLNDCILETAEMGPNSVDLIHTSIPFSNHYEYTPSYNDFGHNQDNDRFFEQMDYLTPELLRVLKPGRVAAIHVKDRILFGNTTGTGMPTVDPFSDMTVFHFRKHGFQYMGRITVVTDVVRENNQTYRLGWTEQCKDGTKMGVGCPEYILLFRRLPSDTSTAYADDPVSKSKEDYTRAQWQIDAHGFWRSSGDRLMSKEELAALPVSNLQAVYRKYSRENVYSYQEHIELAKQLDEKGKLPASFMVVAPGSWHDDIWDDINRMKTLNTNQRQKDLQMHVCLAKGSLVLTKTGFKPIENIELGDMVLTHRGSWKPVIAKKCTGVNPVIQTKAQGVPNLITTPDHKLWTRKTDKVRSKDYLPKTPPTWIEAQDTKGAWVNLKLPDVEHSNLTNVEWWVVGRYLADGHMGTRGDFFVSVGRDKKEEFETMAAPYIGTVAKHDALQYRLKSLSEPLKDMLRKCGKGAGNKQVPIEGICLSKEKAGFLLDGYLSGDGNKTGNATSASSVSRALLLGMAMVAQRARGVIASVFPSKPAGKHIIQGREVNQLQLWVMSWRDSTHHHHGEVLEDGAWKKVSAVEGKSTAETWSIQVEDDASYTAEGCIVKNCPLQVDIVERIITRYSNPGEVVFDPFGGLMTVPVTAIKMGRYGYGIELNTDYFRDGVGYCKAVEAEIDMPTLFDFEEAI